MDVRDAVRDAASSNPIAAQVTEVRNGDINWQSYKCDTLSAEDIDFVTKLDDAQEQPEVQQEILNNEGQKCVETFLNLVTNISDEKTVQYILTLIDDALDDDHTQRANIWIDYAKETGNIAWSYFLPMLNHQDPFIVHMAARVIAKLSAWGRDTMQGGNLDDYFGWVKAQLSSESIAPDPETGEASPYVQCAAGCLHLMLKVNEYRSAWIKAEGMQCIKAVLSTKCGTQLQYQMIFSVWLLSFNGQICEQMKSYDIVPGLANILRESSNDKVKRIVISAFRNLLDKTTDQETVQEYAQAMIKGKVLQSLDKFDKGDINENFKFVHKHLTEHKRKYR